MKASRWVPLLAMLAPLSLAAQQTIPLAAYGGGALRKVAVVIAGDTMDFLFDTGGGVTVISPELAAQLGCTPSGRSRGYRMTGEPVAAPVCRAVPLQLAGFSTRVEASVLDLMLLLGPNAPRVHGMISLRTFAGHTITVDLTGQTLIVETDASREQRTPAMGSVPVRLATGLQGAQLDAFVAIPAGETELWLLWDSGHQGPTFLSPAAATLLGVPPGDGQETTLRLGDQLIVQPVAVKEIIHDGVLNARLVERAVWTIDLQAGRMWTSEVAPLLSLPRIEPGSQVRPPTVDAEGWYQVTMTGNSPGQAALMRLNQSGGQLRFIGEERVFELREVAHAGNRLSFVLPLNRGYPVRLEFDGVHGTGTWGTTERGGAIEAVKVL